MPIQKYCAPARSVTKTWPNRRQIVMPRGSSSSMRPVPCRPNDATYESDASNLWICERAVSVA